MRYMKKKRIDIDGILIITEMNTTLLSNIKRNEVEFTYFRMKEVDDKEFLFEPLRILKIKEPI